MFRKIRLLYRYVFDKQIPFYKKILIIISLLYFVFPVDIVPDYIIGLGWLDDAVVLSFIWFATKSEIDEYGEKQIPKKKYTSKVVELSSKRDKNREK